MIKKGSMVKRILAMLVILTMFVTMLPSAPVYAETENANVNEAITVTNVQLSQDSFILTNDNGVMEITLSVEAEGECDESGSFTLFFTCKRETISCEVRYNEGTQKYEASHSIGAWPKSGTYTLDKVTYNGAEVLVEAEASLSISNQITDHTPPQIKKVWLEVNGEVAEPGAIVEDTDVVKICAEIEDEYDFSSFAELKTNLDGVEEQTRNIGLTLNEESGYYEATIDLSQLEATEWYLDRLNAQDEFFNHTMSTLFGDYEDFKDFYFFVKRDGTCSVPTKDYEVYLIGEGGDRQYVKTITSARVTSLSEIFGEDIPTATAEEREFVGWAYQKIPVEDDTSFAIMDNEIYIYATYDIVYVEPRIEYIDANGVYQSDWWWVEVPYGTTYQGVLDYLVEDFAELKLYEGFLGWGDGDGYEVGGYEGKPIVDGSYMDIRSIYDKKYATMNVVYYNENNEETSDSVVFELSDESVTWYDIIDRMDLTKYNHSKEMGFVEWDEETFYNNVVDPMDSGYINALYNKFPVTVICHYYDEKNVQQHIRETIYVENGDTYADLLEYVKALDISHSKELGFIEWDEPSYDMSQALNPGEEVVFHSVYEKANVIITYNYYNDFLREKSKQLTVYVENGTTVGEVIETYLGSMKHPEGLGFTGWKYNGDLKEEINEWGFIEVNAEYANYVVTVGTEYAAVFGDVDYAEFRVAVEPGTTYAEIAEKISCTHYEGLNFVKWNILDADATTVATDGDEIALSAVYDKAFVMLAYWYCNDNNRYKYSTYIEVVDPSTTLEQVVNLHSDEHVHMDGITLKEWEISGDAKATCGTGVTFVEASAVYNEMLIEVVVESYQVDDDSTYEVFFVPADGTTTTYQDIYDKVVAYVEHPQEYGFIDWDYSLPEGRTLSDVIQSENEWFDLKANYSKYPLELTYTYLTKDGTVKSVTEDLLVPAGTTFKDLLATIELPEDAREAEVIGWSGDMYCEATSEVATGYTSWQVCAIYEDVLPVHTYLETIGTDHTAKDEAFILYVAGHGSVPEVLADLVIGALEKKDNITAKDLGDVMYMWRHISGGSVCFEGYQYMPYINVFTQMDKTVVLFEYPDGTKESVLVDSMQDYVLPKTHDGHNIRWFVTDVFYETQTLEGGEEVEIFGPYVQVQGTYTDYVIPERPEEPEIPETPETPETPEEKPVVKLEEEVIKEEVSKIEKAEENTTVVIDMKKEDGSVATEIPVEVLEAAKGKDVEVVVDMGDYSWTINGQDIAASKLESINLEVTLDTEAIAPSVVDKLAGGDETRQISLTHNGDFGFKAQLTINVGKENVGEYGNLYYYDSNNKLVFMNAGLIDENGNVSLDFTHASDYVVVIGEDRTADEIEKTGDVPTAMPVMMLFVGAMIVLAAAIGKKKIVK